MVEYENVNYPKTSLSRLGDDCNFCFLCNPNEKEERKKFKSLVLKNLEYFIEFFNEKNNPKKDVVKEALEICKNCDYKNPSAFHFLEENGFKFL